LNNVGFQANYILEDTNTNQVNLSDIIDTVTLNVGGMTATGVVNGNTIHFNNANIAINRLAQNQEVLLTAVLKGFASNTITLNTNTFLDIRIDAEAEDNDAVKVISDGVAQSFKPGDVVTFEIYVENQ